MITVIADEGKSQIGSELFQGLIAKGIQADYISLDEVQVKPCVSCGGCTYKTYGKCVVRDDGDWIYPKVIEADVIVFVTPITFGSYSLKMKRVVDKFGLIMDRHYFLENRELVKGGMQGRQFKFFVLGIRENCIDEEIEAFRKLHSENLIITRGKGKVYIVDIGFNLETKNQIIEEVSKA